MPRPKRSKRTPLIMVVDDDLHMLKILTSLLQNEGFRVLTAPSAEDALGILETNIPDVLVTDFGMTGMNGVELALRVQAELPSMAIVITSGHPAEKIEVPASVRFLPKPYAMADLLVTLRQALVSREKAA